jgi:hypothetical protein
MTISSGAWALIGVLIGGSISIFKDWLMDNVAKKRKAKYLAVRVSIKLDALLDALINVQYDNGLDEGRWPDSGEREIHYKNISFDLGDLDVSWQSITPDLAYSILNVTSTLKDAWLLISAAYETDGNSAFHEYKRVYKQIGIDVYALRKEIAIKYKIPENKLSGSQMVELFN